MDREQSSHTKFFVVHGQTPGTMKNVLQKIRQLKSLTDRQTSIILTLTGQCEAQKSESDEKDALIMELLRNCNGIRPALVKGDQPSEKIREHRDRFAFFDAHVL